MPVSSAFDEATERRSARIDLGAIRANVRAYASLVDADLLVRVDHDAYGHGLVAVAGAAVEAGAAWLGVADLAEARSLRSAGIGVPLLVTGTGEVTGTAPDDVHVAIASLHAAQAAARARASGVHLLLDCGGEPRAMDAVEADTLLSTETGIPVTGIMGVYERSVPAGAASAAFAAAKDTLPFPPGALTHLHGTTGVDGGWGGDDDLVRVGGGVYGLPGADGGRRGAPALRATGRIVTVKHILAGEGVSYGYTYRAPADGRIALVTGGYAQGVVRALGNRASVSLHGRRHPIIGRVAMDVCVIDLGDAPASAGDEVVLLGDPGRGEPDLAEWVAATGLTAAEIAIRLAAGFHRSYDA